MSQQRRETTAFQIQHEKSNPQLFYGLLGKNMRSGTCKELFIMPTSSALVLTLGMNSRCQSGFSPPTDRPHINSEENQPDNAIANTGSYGANSTRN